MRSVNPVALTRYVCRCAWTAGLSRDANKVPEDLTKGLGHAQPSAHIKGSFSDSLRSCLVYKGRSEGTGV